MYSSPSFSSYQLMVRCVSCLLPSTYTVFFFRFYLWLCQVFLAVWAFLSLVAEWGLLSSYSAWASHCWLLLLRGTGCSAHRFRYWCHVGSVVAAPRLQSTGLISVVPRLSCCTSCGILLDQGSNRPCFLYWQVDSLPPSHQGSPLLYSFETNSRKSIISTINTFIQLRY